MSRTMQSSNSMLSYGMRNLMPAGILNLVALIAPGLVVAVMASPSLGTMLFVVALTASGLLVFAFRMVPGGRRSGMGQTMQVIYLLVVILIIFYTFPQALTAGFTANTSGWSTSGQNLWPVVALMAEIAALVIIIKGAI